MVGASGQAAALPLQPAAFPAASDPAPRYATEAADLLSAQVAARLSGKPMEALAERTESSTTWANPDGTVTTDAASGPIRFRDKVTGAWRNVDVNLMKSADGSVVARDHPLGLRLGGKTPAAQAARVMASGDAGEAQTAPVPLVSLDAGDGKALDLAWRGVLPEPVLSGTMARYANTLTATDLVIESTRTGFEQFLELKDRSAIDATGSVTLTLNAKGITARANEDRSVSFLDTESGKQVGVLPAPLMWDAYVDPQSGEHTRRADVALKVTQNGDSVDLTLTPDAAFLADPETKFPVTVDPAVNIGASFDTFVQQGYTTDMSTSTELKLGNNGSGQIARSFLHFPMAQITGKQILSAKLNLWNYHSWSCTPSSWEVWDTPHASSSTRWTAQPNWNNKWATSTATKGFSSSCADGWVSQDIKSLAAAWAANGNGSNAMGIRATTESDPYSWKRFNSGNAASNTPYVSVTYNTIPVAGNPMTATPGRANAGKNWTTSTTPALSYTASDSETYFLRSKWELWEGSTNLEVYDSGTEDPVQGKTVSHTVPAGKLINGHTYWYKGRIYDGNSWSNWTPSYYFTVDTTKPGTTAVSSGDFPANTWHGTPDASGNFSGSFTFAPPTNDVAAVEYKLDGASAWVSVATTGAAVSRPLAFAAGKHTVTARTVDAAGNASTQSSYVFYAGSGAALLTPEAGERPARRLDLTAEGQSTYTGVTYQYRRGETDTWKNVPVADVRQASDGGPISKWPVPVINGRPAGLAWNVTDTLAEDGPIDVRAAFADGTELVFSPMSTITVDRNAEGADSDEIGPGTLNLLTGDFALSGDDIAALGLSVSRTSSSRIPDAGAQQDGQAAIFGKEWVSGVTAERVESDYTYVRRVSDTAVDVVTTNGDSIHFTANAAQNGWTPEPGAEQLVLTGSVTTSFTLTDNGGTATTFKKTDPAVASWQVSTITQEGLENSTTTLLSETVVVGSETYARPKRVAAPTSAVSAGTCLSTPSTKGCRVLEYVYAHSTTATDLAFGDFDGQVKEIRIWATEPGSDAATAKPVVTYRYDAAGRMRQLWNPQISPSLKTEYTYDSAGRVTEYTPAGELPWTFTYGKAGSASIASEGMLLKASRSGLAQGSADVPEGTASISVVYDVPLTGPNAPYAMGAADVQAWGQLDLPTDATAIFPPDSVPAAHTGAALTSADYRRAGVHYLETSGQEVNTVAPGGHIATREDDQFGNTIRQLTAANRALALGLTAEDRAQQERLGISQLTSAERATLLSTTSVYDTSGIRLREEFGPLNKVDLAADLKSGSEVLAPAGASISARSWTVNTFDEGRPVDALLKDQITKVVTGIQVLEYPAVHGETRTTQTVYDWAKGLATQKIKDPASLAITEKTEYDADGRVIKQLLPAATGNDAATRVITYWSATGSGTCQGRPEWAGQVCSTSPGGAITGGGANPTQLPTTTTEYDVWGNPAKVTETANGTTRTTTTTYDEAGRPTKTTRTAGNSQAVPEATTEYAPATGRPVKTASPTGGTLTRTYDKLGRQISYTDADGGITTTEYDLLGRPVKITDNAPSTTTIVYDHAAEPRGMATATTDSIAGTTRTSYNADGLVTTEKLPGGYTLQIDNDSTGAATSRTYTRDSDGEIVYEDLVTLTGHGQVSTHSGWSYQAHAYDAIGRLKSVDDSAGAACTRRTYTFDSRSNRTALTQAVAGAGGACTSTGGTTTAFTYDSADRITGAGYTYDGLGRTTTTPDGATSYYANDLAYQQTAGTRRQTWQLDSGLRYRSWKIETDDGASWSETSSKVNHYGNDGDNPRWITEDTATGAITRNVTSSTGQLAATTGHIGNVVLQLTNVHGDVALSLPLDQSMAPIAADADEYGNPRAGQQTGRYGWLGGHLRSSETLSGTILMGARMYSPTTGRFLSADPVYGGSATAYDYANQDPTNQFDLDGRMAWVRKCGTNWKWYGYKFWCKFYVTRFHTKVLKEDIGTMGPVGAALVEAWMCSKLIHPVAAGACTALAWAYTWWSVHHINAANERGGCFTWEMGATVGPGYLFTWARPGNVRKSNKNCRK
ncbi:DNRLRE domain-containing protein [Streptomyces sp. ISL-36]|nr:DNRLRE domain-containing protein [Streptomyces sp. ISL-36]